MYHTDPHEKFDMLSKEFVVEMRALHILGQSGKEHLNWKPHQFSDIGKLADISEPERMQGRFLLVMELAVCD
eukprot:COSAG05_NODE_10962_length_537_cov_0.824201_1_plen_71_part_01